MLKQQFRNALEKSNTVIFKTKQGRLFKLSLASDSYFIARKVGEKWRFYHLEKDLNRLKVAQAATLKAFEIIETM